MPRESMLDVVIYFIGSGLAFFAGAGCILFGLALSLFGAGRPVQLARNLAVLVGGVFVIISSTPVDWWLYAMLGLVTCLWLPLEWFHTALPKRCVIAARLAVFAIWPVALGLEMPYHIAPTLPALGRPTLFLVGDSVSAGMSDAEKETWPKLLAQQHDIDVRDFSKMGATVGSARKQAKRIGDQGGLVLLEIGGNDLLGATTADQFEERLELLLGDVCRADRTVVMVELPLPPLANRFGMIQRRLARQHDVALIPKRLFIAVLTTPGATLDGIHLSRQGHALMAEMMWQAVESWYQDKQQSPPQGKGRALD